MTNREAAQRLGVGLETLTVPAWKWYSMLRGCGKCVRPPGGGRCNIYPVADIERIAAAQVAAATRVIPEGFVDRNEACRMFGVTGFVWKNWIRQGKIGFGQILPSPHGARIKIYAIADLERMREDLFGDDKVYKQRDGIVHVPAEFVRREEAWVQFGVSKTVWDRWEREGKITCGERVLGGPKLYKVEDINRMLDEYGRWAPPYPDADRPGVVRVPLSGRDINRREAIIDAESLPLIEGRSCSWSTAGIWGFVSTARGETERFPLRRLIMGITDGDSNVRHRNGDGLDCRRENLMVCTVQQRLRNKRKVMMIKGRPSTSQFKGVYWEKWTKKWRACIKVDGKTRRLGRFTDQIAAAVAYDEAAKLWLDEHARLNFPEGVDAWVEQEKASWKMDAPPQAKAKAA